MHKLLILTDDAAQYQALIEKAHLPNLEFTTQLADCDLVLGEPRKIKDALPLLSHPKWIQSIYAGVEALTDSPQRRDYTLTNARNVFGPLMSEYVFSYLLAHEKKIFARQKAQQENRYDRFESGWLRGKTIGLLGVGSIGAHLAGTAKHFEMKVWGYTVGSETSTQVDRYFHPKNPISLRERGRGEGEDKPLTQFASGLDYLIIVLPRTNDTNNMVNAEVLNALPNHAVLVNVGRGNAIDEPALVEALTNNKIAGAILDVTAQEPLPADHPFWSTPNLLLTFHTSAMSYPEDIAALFIENYHLFVEGKPLKYVVDFERGY